ncbi:telomere binding protein [Apophysomyces ossiformis]|uniref:Telomere binding protein n=1 Tax=Apophysomyces ossiformis TaxID=679940 RepID=A0A8H7BN38_9FUNG|nr:telomere binding protein [Apophysomyces ossiformis]
MTDLAAAVDRIQELDNVAKEGNFDTVQTCISAALELPPTSRLKLFRHVAWTHHVTLVVQTLLPAWPIQLNQYRPLLESTMVMKDEDPDCQCTMALVSLRTLLEALSKDVSLDTLEIYANLLKYVVSPKLLAIYLTMKGETRAFCDLICSIPSRLANAFGLQDSSSNAWYLDKNFYSMLSVHVAARPDSVLTREVVAKIIRQGYVDECIRSIYPVAVSHLRSGAGSYWPDVWIHAQSEKLWQATLFFVRESVTENTISSAAEELAKILLGTSSSSSSSDFLTYAIYVLGKSRKADTLLLRLAIAATVYAAGLEDTQDSGSNTDDISSALLILIGYLRKEEAQDLFYNSSLPSGAHRWLENGDMEAAKLGMAVAKSVSTLIDSEDVQLDTSILDPANDQELLALLDLVFVRDALRKGEPSPISPKMMETVLDNEMEEEENEEELDPDALMVAGEDDEDESDLEPYPMEEESDEEEFRAKSKPKKPVYINDLIQFLKDAQDPLKLEIGLDAAEELVRRKTGVGVELHEFAVQLVNALTRVPTDYDIPDCEDKQQRALAALMVAEPHVATPRAIDTLYHRSTSINVQQIVLTAIHLAARELAGWSKEHDGSTEEQLEDMTKALDIPTQSVGKVRVFSRSMELQRKEAKKIKTNRLSGLAGPVFFFPLLVGWWEGAQTRIKSWIGNNKVLTEQLIRTLDMIMYYSTNLPEKRRIVTEYFEFALALRYADCSAGMTRALLLGITVILNTSYKDQEWILWQNYARELEETKFWVEGIVESTKEDETIKQAALGILVRLMEITKKAWQIEG